MALAVTNQGTERCSAGSEDDDITAFLGIGITLEGGIASTNLDCRPVPDFSDCAIWAAITLGSQTDCIPAVSPLWSPGVSSVFWNLILANDNLDTGTCALGGTIIVQDPGTTSVIIM